MPSTTPQQRLRSLAIASIMVVIALAYGLALSIFKLGQVEDAARQCFSAAEAGYWQHTAVQFEDRDPTLSHIAGKEVAAVLYELEAANIQDAFTECERLIERAGLD